MLSISTSNSIQGRELSHAIGRQESSRMALDSGIAVGRIGAIEFIAGSKPGQFWDLIDLVQKGYCIQSILG
jgi:hypothetical protein